MQPFQKPSSGAVTIQSLKRAAKRLSKRDGNGYSKALEQVSKEKGFQNWRHARLLLSGQSTPQVSLEPALPVTPTKRYSATPMGPHYYRPDVVVPINVHRSMASKIRATMLFAEQRLRASCSGPLDTLRSILDDWVGLEHRKSKDEVLIST